MSIKINISVEADHILVTANGVYKHFDALELMRMAIGVATREKIPKILIDVRKIVGEISTMERYDLAVLISQLVQQQTGIPFIKIAMVGNKPIIDANRFGETVAVNRGVQGIATTDLNEALKWLGVNQSI